ncbi:TetR family transcriptional regulator [Nonlabens xylanidelens]|uniref:TetR family transcriptional regulator n=1 Tax=Nonlabens xylanidelens TaxID=191564 RepID=A0A2S6ILH7_9FLAO|nr:TetR/AcrR family transcriptional regulator [Nonlabens xylanidelens]PPK95069.1 TetR family transcriptional regulator [Nonlabens xylanidelens]PQJ17602.1 TetR family transcriptional regulator [Nonlabens xylanidelens]
MHSLLKNLKVEINDKLYLKDPESSDLGKRIVSHSIEMIYELGFEQFTFKKLGVVIKSNESSIYRYFESKHKLLLYLTSWYWSWIEYQLILETMVMTTDQDKLIKAVEILTQEVSQDSNFSHINEVLLNKIIISEFSKSYLTKSVDQENKEGFFAIYKRLVVRLKDLITAVDATYKFPSSLSSMIIDGALHQHFLKDHFAAITDCNSHTTPTHYFLNLINQLIITNEKR